MDHKYMWRDAIHYREKGCDFMSVYRYHDLYQVVAVYEAMTAFQSSLILAIAEKGIADKQLSYLITICKPILN